MADATIEIITNTLMKIEKSLSELAVEGKEFDNRINRIDHQIATQGAGIQNFWERDWPRMMSEMRGINEKLGQQLERQAQSKAEVDFLKQRLDLLIDQFGKEIGSMERIQGDKIAEIKKQSDEQRMVLWKLMAAGGGSGAIISGLIQLMEHLIK